MVTECCGLARVGRVEALKGIHGLSTDFPSEGKVEAERALLESAVVMQGGCPRASCTGPAVHERISKLDGHHTPTTNHYHSPIHPPTCTSAT